MKRYIAFGDIHGMYDQFKELYDSITIKEDDELIFLGDYIDRGSKNKEVLDFLMALNLPNKVIFLRGNHEDMFLRRLDSLPMAMCWINNGGIQTMRDFDTQEIEKFPKEYEDWIRNNTVLFYQPESANLLFVHAGINPAYPLNEQTESDIMWIRDEFLFSKKDFGVMIIHGHTPNMKGIDVRENRINVDTGSCFGGYISAVIVDDNGKVIEKHSIECPKDY